MATRRVLLSSKSRRATLQKGPLLLLSGLFILAACQNGDITPALTPPATLETRPLKCGDIITLDTRLDQDLVCQGDGLIIGADNVHLDLGGHRLSGPGKGPWVWPNRALSSVGVRVQDRDGIRISNGTVTSFATGILLDTSTNSEIDRITARENFYGMYLVAATDSRLSENITGPNTYGIHLQRSSRNLVTRNESSGNRYNSPGGYGLNLISSHDNEITENVMAGNVIQGIWLIASTGNLIYRNDFIDNRPNGADQAVYRTSLGDIVDAGGTIEPQEPDANAWYNEETGEGNFWSDYEGEDTEGDGIGDTPYVIVGTRQAQDSHPLMNPVRWQGSDGERR